jgi:hypothetical protein
MESQENKSKGSDEIDISALFSWIGQRIASVGYGFIAAIAGVRNLFYKNRLFFIGLIIVGLVLGTLYSKLIKKEYFRSTMVFSCDYLNTRILENTVDKFNLLCSEADRRGLMAVLKIDSATAYSIRKFEFEPFVSEDDVIEMEILREQLSIVVEEKQEIVDKVINKLIVENKNAYQITALVYNPDVVTSLEKAIVNYFKTSPYLLKRIESNRVNLLARREKLVNESVKLDSLKIVLFQNYQNVGKTSRGTGNVFLGDEKLANPLDVFTADLALNNEILGIDRQLYVEPEFEVVDGFITIKAPDSLSLGLVLFISFWISVVMGYLIIGLYRFDRVLASYQKDAR